MEENPNLGNGDCGGACRKASILAFDPEATDRLVSFTLGEPDPDQINLMLLRQFFERRAAARTAKKLERVEALFRAFFCLPVHVRPEAAKILMAGAR